MSKQFKGLNPEGDNNSEASAGFDIYLSELSKYESQAQEVHPRKNRVEKLEG